MTWAYMIEWGHTYMVHFGAWVSMFVAGSVYKEGLPESVSSLIWKAAALAMFVAVFSSHTQHHFLSHFLGK